MTCAHCCMNATTKGEDMSLDTFKRIIDEYCIDNYITLGGGEPTLNPKFNDMLMYSLAHCESVFMVTNGSITDTAITLAALNSVDKFTCLLSQDEYHDFIDPKVIEAFYKASEDVGRKNEFQQDFIRDAGSNLIPVGRALTNEIADESIIGCGTGGPIIKPSGEAYWCICEGAPKLDLDDIPYDYYDNDYCWSTYKQNGGTDDIIRLFTC